MRINDQTKKSLIWIMLWIFYGSLAVLSDISGTVIALLLLASGKYITYKTVDVYARGSD